MKNAFSARENPFTDFSLAFAKCFCSLAWLFQCKQTNLTGIRKCIKICSSGIYHLLVSMFRTHTHTERGKRTHTCMSHLWLTAIAPSIFQRLKQLKQFSLGSVLKYFISVTFLAIYFPSNLSVSQSVSLSHRQSGSQSFACLDCVWGTNCFDVWQCLKQIWTGCLLVTRVVSAALVCVACSSPHPCSRSQLYVLHWASEHLGIGLLTHQCSNLTSGFPLRK